MKITQVKDAAEVWPHFYEFCIKSKPYDFCSIKSKSLRDNKIKDIFNEFFSYRVYKAQENDTIVGFCFIKEEEYCLDVAFIFGIWRSVRSSKLILATHKIFNKALQDCNKNYLKSEIRRTFKVRPYKKWIEKYDKTAIIFNNDNNTVVWCNKDIMTVKFKVVGSNKTTEHLMGKELFLGKTQRIPNGLMREFNDGEKTYLLEEKGVDFMSESVLLHGLLSDKESYVANISLQFIPHK